MTENVKILALRLLDKFDKHISAQLISSHHNTNPFQDNIDAYKDYPDFDVTKGPIGFTGLQATAFLGIVEIFSAVLEMKEWDVNAKDNASCTPLMWAALGGHEEVVKMLLERGDINPNLEDRKYGRTPLIWAARQGQEGVVKLFLEREGINPDQACTIWGETPLFWAAAFGHEGIVKMLLEQVGVNPNRREAEHGFTPLKTAVANGHERVVKILLEREDINPNIADTGDGCTPLSYAAANGYEGIVKLLLDRNDVRIDIRDHENQTALSLALSEGYYKIARMISERAKNKSGTADPGDDQESLPQSVGGEEMPIAEIELRDNHSNTNITDPSRELTFPPGDPDAPEELSDWEGSVPDSAESIVPSSGRPVPPSSFPCGLRGAGVPEVQLPLIQTILRQLSQSRSTST